jgi:hypothetical protein
MVCAFVYCRAKGQERLDPKAVSIDEPLWYCLRHLEIARRMNKKFKEIENEVLFHQIRKGEIRWAWIQEIPPEKRAPWKNAVIQISKAYQFRCQFQETIKPELKGDGHEYYIRTLFNVLEEMWPLLIDEDITVWQPVMALNRIHRKAYQRRHPWDPRF